MNIKVMTYNIFSGKNLAREQNIAFAAGVMNSIGADIIAVNEVRRNTSDNGNVDQARELARLTSLDFAFGRSLSLLGGEYGNALLTRFPILEQSVVDIPDAPRNEDAFYEHRVMLRCLLDCGETRLAVYVAHFGLARNEREAAVKCALSNIEKEIVPVLLMGDFNATPDAPELAPLYASLTECFGGATEPCTFPSDKPNIKIDYIFARGAGLSAGAVPDTQMSDHRPLVADCAIHAQTTL